jgi:sugar/nucleoside kinase (ribokinase family)
MAQRMEAGGNAFNTARALARLGVHVQFSALTSRTALDFATKETAGEPIDLHLVRTSGKTAKTVSIEFGPERVNVMLNDPGSLEGLQAADLGEELASALSKANAVHIANWGQNQTNGTAFALEVLRTAKKAGAQTFLDPSDVWGREQAVLDFIGKIPSGTDLDFLLVNESELRELARVLLLHAGGTSPCAHDDVDGQGTEFTKRTKAAVAAHTPRRSQLFRQGKSLAMLETPVLTPTRTTGAGDVWNAGFIAGTVAGLSPRESLELAAAAGRHYVTHTGRAPTIAELRGSLATGA